MNLALPLARRWLGLPASRCRTESSTEWVALTDGTRLATTIVRPMGVTPRSAVLIRTLDRCDAPLRLLLGRLIAEREHLVVLQECRGRGRSEGKFTPFANEAADGGEAIAWLTSQPWFPGSLALVGFGYAGFAAWAALGSRSEAIGALVVGFASREPYAWLHSGGALQLETALAWGVGLGERDRVDLGSLDLERGARHQPAREADRVTLRQCDAYRDWVDHPEADAYWSALTPALPVKPPPTLVVTGWHHPTLGAALGDFESLASRAGDTGAAQPELVVGAWSALGGVRRARTGPLGEATRAISEFLDRRLSEEVRARAPVRVSVIGTDRWRAAATWPLPAATSPAWPLHSDGGANGDDGDGRLTTDAPDPDEPPDCYVYDPADAVPTCGGPVLSSSRGAADQTAIESRADVLCYTSEPLSADLELVGPVRVLLHVATDAEATDFSAKLAAVDASGGSRALCDGIVRLDGDDKEPLGNRQIEVDCWAIAVRLRAGECLRLQVSSSNFPRFDRHPNRAMAPGTALEGDAVIARQTVFHDALRPSRLVLSVVPF